MLMTVLKGELAIRQSKALIRLFKKMKDYIINEKINSDDNLIKLSLQTNDNTKEIAEIKKEMLTKKELSKVIKSFMEIPKYSEVLILNEKVIEADIAYNNIYNQAKKSIYIIDNYIGLKTLIHFKDIENIDIHIFSSNINKMIHKSEIEDFKKEYPNVNIHFQKMKDIIHDRYIILDYNTDTEKMYLSGASSKDAGRKISTVIEIKDTKKYHLIVDEIIEESLIVT